MTYKKFKKLINKYFDVENEKYFINGKVYFVVSFAYLKFDIKHSIDSVRFEIRYHRKNKAWCITPTNHTFTNPRITNIKDKFERIIESIQIQVGKELHYIIDYERSNQSEKEN